MLPYDFDQIIERKNTDSAKYNNLKELFGRDDLIPLWVADMDFLSPPAVTAALLKRAQHGIFGYPAVSDEYYESIIHWQKNVHDWDVAQNEICFVSGVVKGIAFAIDAFTKEGVKIIIQPPVYHPFRIVPEMHKREVAYNPLIFDGTQYRMDFRHLEELVGKNNCKMLLLSNPHNPGGKLWCSADLSRLAEICAEHKILVIADEIHADLALNGRKHIPFASVSETAAQNCIVLCAPSKTFNIAGIVASYSIIKNKEIRDKYFHFLKISELDCGTVFTHLATQTAYEQGGEWLQALKKYVWENVLFADNFLKENIPQIKVVLPEASFLLWLDCRALALTQEKLVDLFVNKARLALNDGAMFGKEGTGFMRMNIGCPRSVLEKALQQLKEAVSQ